MSLAVPNVEAAAGLRLSLNGLDLALIVIYFAFVLGIGFALRRLITTSVVIVALKEAGGIHGLFAKLSTNGHDFTSAWSGVGLGGHNPIGDWISLVFGLSFCLSFGYWTTNFAEVQWAMSAKDDNAARLTPIIGAFPKAIIPLGIVIPGMAAVLLIPGLGTGGGLAYNYAIPALMNKYLPTGVLAPRLARLDNDEDLNPFSRTGSGASFLQTGNAPGGIRKPSCPASHCLRSSPCGTPVDLVYLAVTASASR